MGRTYKYSEKPEHDMSINTATRAQAAWITAKPKCHHKSKSRAGFLEQLAGHKKEEVDNWMEILD